MAFVGVVVAHVVGTSSAALHYVAPETRDAILVRACTLNGKESIDLIRLPLADLIRSSALAVSLLPLNPNSNWQVHLHIVIVVDELKSEHW